MCELSYALDWKLQCCRKFWNVESSFWQAENEKNASFWVVLQVQNWCDLEVAVTPRMSLDQQNRWKCGMSKGTYPQKQKNHHLWVGDVLGITLGQFGAFWKAICTSLQSEQQNWSCVMMWLSWEVWKRPGIAIWHDSFPSCRWCTTIRAEL